MYVKKISLISTESWNHHHSGWPLCLEYLNELNTTNGISCYTNVEPEDFSKAKINKLWIGFFHRPPTKIVEKLTKSYVFQNNLKYCKGLYTFSKYTSSFLNNLNVLSENLIHPIKSSKHPFIMNKDYSIISIGFWMRKFEIFEKIKSNRNKFILNSNIQEYKTNIPILDHLPKKEYEILLSKNVVFLELKDSSANNTILECIIRNTPIIINRLPAVEEYLGKEYPLFYSNAEEAEELVNNIEKIKQSHEYLKNIDKNVFSYQYFLNSIVNSNIYKNICNKIYI